MAFSAFAKSGDHASPMSEINMIPLIDVMLVLLVIFIVTAPLLTHAVKIELPKASSQPNLTRPDHVDLSVNAAGTAYWDGERVSSEELAARLAVAAAHAPQPELHIHADRSTRYESVAGVMAAAARAGLTRIGFVSDPTVTR
jgi:biopolymer transport protein ExbD